MNTKLVSTGGKLVLFVLALGMVLTAALLNIARSQVEDALEGLPAQRLALEAEVEQLRQNRDDLRPLIEDLRKQAEQTRLHVDEETMRLIEAQTALRKTKEEENAARERVEQLAKNEADLSAAIASFEPRERDLQLSIEGLHQQKTRLELLIKEGIRRLEEINSDMETSGSELEQTRTNLIEAKRSLTEATTKKRKSRRGASQHACAARRSKPREGPTRGPTRRARSSDSQAPS